MCCSRKRTFSAQQVRQQAEGQSRAAADSVHRVNMHVDELMKVCLSIGVMASKVIPEQYVVQPNSSELREIGLAGLGRKEG